MRKTDALTEQTTSGRKPTLTARWCAPAMEQRASNVKLSLKVSVRLVQKCFSKQICSYCSDCPWKINKHSYNLTHFGKKRESYFHVCIVQPLKQSHGVGGKNKIQTFHCFCFQLRKPVMISTISGHTRLVKHMRDQRMGWFGTAPVSALVGEKLAARLQVRCSWIQFTSSLALQI